MGSQKKHILSLFYFHTLPGSLVIFWSIYFVIIFLQYTFWFLILFKYFLVLMFICSTVIIIDSCYTCFYWAPFYVILWIDVAATYVSKDFFYGLTQLRVFLLMTFLYAHIVCKIHWILVGGLLDWGFRFPSCYILTPLN